MAMFGGPVCPDIDATGKKDWTVPLDVRSVESGPCRSLELIYFSLITTDSSSPISCVSRSLTIIILSCTK